MRFNSRARSGGDDDEDEVGYDGSQEVLFMTDIVAVMCVRK